MTFRRNGKRTATLLLALAAAGCGGGGGGDGTANTGAGDTLLSITLRADGNRVRSGAGCVAEIDALRSCIGFNNLAPPSQVLGPYDAGSEAARLFMDRTGTTSGRVFAVAGPTPQAAAVDAFVQLQDDQTFGIHVDTRTRTGNLSSINPLHQFDRFAPAQGAPDTRVFPWAEEFGSEVELVISFDLRVKRLAAASASAAYGQAVLDLFDRTSGGHFYFLAQAYGTIPAPDNVLRDSVSGRVIVATSFTPSSGYGRSLGSLTQFTPAGFVSTEPQGTGGHYELRVARDEFQRVLNAARALEPSLSASPADYMLDDYHFNNEVAGDGEIGVTLAAITLRIARR